jgi:hypothetical protein
MAADDDDFPGDADETEPPAPPPAAKGGTAAAPVKPAAEPEPAPEPTKPAHSPLLTKKWLALGGSPESLAALSPAEAWEEIERFQAAEAGRAAPPAAKPAPKADEPPDEDAEFEAYLKPFEDVDPGFVKHQRRQYAAQKALKAALAETLDKVKGFEKEKQERQAAAVHRALDAGFAALPPEYAEFFGEGDIGDLADDKQKKRRHAVVQAMGYQEGDGKAAIAKKIAAAAELLAGHLVQPAPADPYGLNGHAAPPKPAKKPQPRDPETNRFTKEDFANGHLARPSGKRTGVEELTDGEAVRRVRTEHGATATRRVAVDDEDDDDLPD